MAFSQGMEIESHNTSRHIYIGLNASNIYVNQYNAYFQSKEAYCIYYIPKASGEGNNLGLSFTYTLSKKIPSVNALVLNVNFEHFLANSRVKGDDEPTIVTSGNDPSETRIINIPTYWYANIDLSFLTIEFLYKQIVNENIPLGFSVGPYFSYISNNNFYQSYSLDGKNKFEIYPKIKYINHNRTVILYDDKIRDINKYIFGIKTKIIYQIQMNKNFQVIPEISYALPLSNIVYNTNWRAYPFGFGVTINYRIK